MKGLRRAARIRAQEALYNPGRRVKIPDLKKHSRIREIGSDRRIPDVRTEPLPRDTGYTINAAER